MRLVPDHPRGLRAVPVRFTFDGTEVSAPEGETVVAALLRAAPAPQRLGDGAPRGQFCCMGLCQECAVIVEGQKVESRRLPVSAGLRVASGRAPMRTCPISPFWGRSRRRQRRALGRAAWIVSGSADEQPKPGGQVWRRNWTDPVRASTPESHAATLRAGVAKARYPPGNTASGDPATSGSAPPPLSMAGPTWFKPGP